MKILVTGSRDWTDNRRIMKRLMEEPDGTAIIEGGARGVDSIARLTAVALGFKVFTVSAGRRIPFVDAIPIEGLHRGLFIGAIQARSHE